MYNKVITVYLCYLLSMLLMSEDDLQIAIFDYLRLKHPALLAFHVPNGGRRSMREGAKFKRMGVKPGVCDIIILHRHKIYFIELKVKKNGLTDTQKDFIKRVEELGHFTALVRSLDQFREVLNMILNPS